jgi:hypothetical protein
MSTNVSPGGAIDVFVRNALGASESENRLAQDSSAAIRDLVRYHISGIKPTQVCRATGPIFAAHPAYRFHRPSSGAHR